MAEMIIHAMLELSSKSNPNDPSESATPSPFPTNSYAVTRPESATRFIIGQSNYFSHLRSGTITGIPAILLNEGALTNLDVIVFLVNALPDVPDFRAAGYSFRSREQDNSEPLL